MFRFFYFLYYIAWSLVLPCLVALSKTLVPKWRGGLDNKLGKLNQEDFPDLARAKKNLQPTRHLQGPIWFHAVSVGELNALIPLLDFFSGLRIVLSVTTETAFQMAKNKLKEDLENNRIKLFYMPWDHPEIIQKVLARIRPCAIILMESEIWPALLMESHKLGIKLAIINAKLSDKSLRFYKLLPQVFFPIFKTLDLVLCQSPADSRKYLTMGVSKEKIFMTGNMKFSAIPSKSSKEALQFRELIGYKNSDLIIVCGSTHEEEEALLIAIFQELKLVYPNLRLILAPRHPERFSIVEDFINSAAKLTPIRLSKLKKSINARAKLNLEEKASISDILKAVYEIDEHDDLDNLKVGSSNDVVLVDTIGDLMDMFSISNIAVIGGTINEKIGGHNVLEPASCGIPVIIGPFYYKNKFMVESLEEAGGIKIAEAKEDIRLILESLIKNADLRILMGAQGKNLTQKHKKISFYVAEKIKSELLNL